MHSLLAIEHPSYTMNFTLTFSFADWDMIERIPGMLLGHGCHWRVRINVVQSQASHEVVDDTRSSISVLEYAQIQHGLVDLFHGSTRPAVCRLKGWLKAHVH